MLVLSQEELIFLDKCLCKMKQFIKARSQLSNGQWACEDDKRDYEEALRIECLIYDHITGRD